MIADQIIPLRFLSKRQLSLVYLRTAPLFLAVLSYQLSTTIVLLLYAYSALILFNTLLAVFFFNFKLKSIVEDVNNIYDEMLIGSVIFFVELGLLLIPTLIYYRVQPQSAEFLVSKHTFIEIEGVANWLQTLYMFVIVVPLLQQIYWKYVIGSKGLNTRIHYALFYLFLGLNCFSFQLCVFCFLLQNVHSSFLSNTSSFAGWLSRLGSSLGISCLLIWLNTRKAGKFIQSW